ncbi:hypothetical protein ACLB1G_12405 [Oxalobacteraceae bacterium A2-2]
MHDHDAEMAALRRDITHTLQRLEQEVQAWLTGSPAAWDRRSHPFIRQYLVDMRECWLSMEEGIRVSPTVIVVAAERLGARVGDTAILALIAVLRQLLQDYLRLREEDG